MKSVLKYIFIFFTSSVLACGDGYWEGMSFYNLFKQTNISAEAFYPFLKDEYNTFYGDDDYSNDKIFIPKGNIQLWKKLLKKWSIKEIEEAIYTSKNFNWSGKNSKIEKRAKMYIDFAKECSNAFSHRQNRGSWDYDELLEEKNIDTKALLTKANELLKQEKNEQLKARYYYQIIRILHYSKAWQDAIKFYEANIANKLPKDEIYYYITDQVAGCYYSTGQVEKAAYLFTNILNNSVDRKKSAFLSFNFCAHQNAEGKSFFTNTEDEKNLLLIKSLRGFADEISNIKQFINYDANDERVELLFMRALSGVERNVWPKDIGSDDKTLPHFSDDDTQKHLDLLAIAEAQLKNKKVNNKDFWALTSSYLSFIKQDLTTAKNKLKNVKTFTQQKKALAALYEVFEWKIITSQNEIRIAQLLKEFPKQKTSWYNESNNDVHNFILDKIAHTYYKNNQIAKAFLIHNDLSAINNIGSIELLNALEAFGKKPQKNAYEKLLIAKLEAEANFSDFVNYHKGIYYLFNHNPEIALTYFNKSNNYEVSMLIPNTVFSNNIKECYRCDESFVMDDEVYKASVFSSFIQPTTTRKELAENLIQLKKLTSDTKKWKAKLANYLLGNFYFNISNTGYYRGLLTGNTNTGDYIYVNYANNKYGGNNTYGDDIIKNRKGYNLSDITYNEKHHFNLSTVAKKYYENVISLSTDKELNARCLYLIAKCELNDFYNNGSADTFSVKLNEYNDLTLPNYKSFKTLKAEYSDTRFHDMIIKQCSYYQFYSAAY